MVVYRGGDLETGFAFPNNTELRGKGVVLPESDAVRW